MYNGSNNDREVLIMIFYFSGTGNSKYCADMLADKLEDIVINTADFIKKDGKFNSDKPLIFVCPTYAWKIPKVFADFIKKSNFSGNNNAYFIMTCGGETGNAQKEITDLCMQKGFIYRGLLPIVMPDNYIVLFPAPKEEQISQMIEKAHKKINDNINIIKKLGNFKPLNTNAFDNLKSGAINTGMYKFFIKTKKFKVENTCISCGKCEKVCPLNNIKLINNKPVWGNDCTHCMACISYCPVSAIDYGKATKGKRRYTCCEYKKER